MKLSILNSAMWIALAAGAIGMTNTHAAGCDGPAHRAFDFWLGEWIVTTPDGKVAGTNRIEQEYNGCVLHERYNTGKGYSGESLNIYDATRKLWHQTWVDTSGTLLLLEGGLRGKNMVLEGQTANPSKAPTQHRITWSPDSDGSVRQLWESTNDAGQWTVVFDGRYTRK